MLSMKTDFAYRLPLFCSLFDLHDFSGLGIYNSKEYNKTFETLCCLLKTEVSLMSYIGKIEGTGTYPVLCAYS